MKAKGGVVSGLVPVHNLGSVGRSVLDVATARRGASAPHKGGRAMKTLENELRNSRDLWEQIAKANRIIGEDYRRLLEKRIAHCCRLEAQITTMRLEHEEACRKCRRLDRMDDEIAKRMEVRSDG